MKELFVDVILPFAVSNHFTYSVPKNLHTRVKRGMRVEVEFGKSKLYTAIIDKIHSDKPSSYAVKEIGGLLDDHAKVNNKQLDMWQWIASYYLCKLGEVMHAAMPTGLKLSSETRIMLNPANEEIIPSHLPPSKRTDKQLIILEALMNQDKLTINEVRTILEQRSVHGLIQSMFSNETIVVQEF